MRHASTDPGVDNDARSRIGNATEWVADKAGDTLRRGAGYVRDRATTAVERRTRADPIRAILIAAGVGALLMGLAARMTRIGARAVRRNVQR